MKKAFLTPYGWPCELQECPPGPFLFKQDTLGFKNEYADPPYCMECGEIFWGGATRDEDRQKLIVQPLIVEWDEF
jgi:hypothetical protein